MPKSSIKGDSLAELQHFKVIYLIILREYCHTPLFRTHTTVFFHSYSEAVPLARLAPDIALVHVSSNKINYNDLQINGLLGEGGMALVYKGTLNGEQVWLSATLCLCNR